MALELYRKQSLTINRKNTLSIYLSNEISRNNELFRKHRTT